MKPQNEEELRMSVSTDEIENGATVYEENGFVDRDDYLQNLSDEYNLPIETVYEIAVSLGEIEDFDQLPAELSRIEDNNDEEEED